MYKRDGVDDAAEEVIVQVLKEEATMDEEIGFREISLFAAMGAGHPNVLNLIGHSYDAIPRLQAFEFCQLGDLKSFMVDNRGQRKSMAKSSDMFDSASLVFRSIWNVQQARNSPQILSGNHFRSRSFASEKLCLAGLGSAVRPGHGRNVGEGEPYLYLITFNTKILTYLIAI